MKTAGCVVGSWQYAGAMVAVDPPADPGRSRCYETCRCVDDCVDGT